MKKNKLYTVNRWNQPAFMVDRQRHNIFDGFTFGQSSQMNNNPFGVSFNAPTVNTPKIDWSNPIQRNMALGQTKGLTSSFGSGNPINLQQSNQMLSKTISNTGSSSGGGLFSKGGAGWGMAGAAAGVLGSINTGDPRGMWDTLDPVYHLAGGRESAAGNAMSDAGVSLTQAGLSSGQPYLALAGAGLKVIGGLTNAAFGIKENTALKKAVEEGINRNKNFVSNAGSFDEVTGPIAATTNTNVYEGGWFSGGRAREKNEELKRRMIDAKTWANRSVDNNIFNLQSDQMNDALANLSAFGGQLESEFLDNFSSDPIGAAVRYNQGLEKLAAEREAAQAAAEEANQIAAQQALINSDVQNQGMQFAMESAVPALDTFTPLSSPSVATDDYSRLKSSLKKSEGFSRKATTLSGEAHPTIGYGFYNVYPGTTRKVKAGDTITEEEADRYLDTAIRERADELSRKVPNWDKLNSGQKDALIDLAFNAGSNAPHFRKNSKLMKALANEDWETAAANLATTSKNPAFKKGMQNRSNRRRNMFMGDYGLKAFGGELGTNGTDFTNGLLYIDEGGSHEDNPLDGVPMGLDPEGVPNLVEEGETVYNNYVFSDRLKVPFFMYKELGLGGVMKKKGKEMSFADASKKLAQESEQRPNDPISQAGLQASLSKLAEIQETERMRKQAKEYTGLQGYSCGGRMTKKYPNGGYLWDDFWKTTNPTSKKKGNSSDKYQIDTTYKGNVKDREAESDYQAFTDYMLNNASDEERLKYFRWIDDNTGRKRTYTDVNGNLLDGWQQKYRDARTDGLWGIQHYTPKKASSALSSSIAFDQDLANAAIMADMGRKATPVITDDVRQRIALDGYTPDTTERAIASAGERAAVEGDNEGEGTPKTYDTWMRYAPAVGAGIMTLTDALGLTNKPDYTYADALAAAARRAGYAPKISYNPVGNYLTYKPLDIWYEQNRANALSRATDRNIMNTSGGNRGTAMAGLVANGYNSQLASGNLYRQAVESNLEQRRQVEDFNRRTNMFNSQMGLEADMANARYHQAAQQMGLSGLAQAAALRDSIDSRIGAARSANITNFLNSLGNIGRENFALNQLNWDKSRKYSTDASGRSSYERKRKAK